jgi:cbb3-type cytochrome oxidase maturation protein
VGSGYDDVRGVRPEKRQAAHLLSGDPGVRRAVVLEYLMIGEFVVAFLMGLAALCALFWAVASGAFRNVEAIKHQVLRLEEDDDRRH